MLKVNGLKVNYGSIEAVKGVDFEVKENDIVTLIGANGAGKSTILKTVAGLIKPAEGKIEFMGEDIGAYLRKDSLSNDIEWIYSLFPRLKERHWQHAGTLSGGEQQMLALARALMSRPKLLMMDEPSLGLAPIIVKGIFEIINEIQKSGVTVLLIEQNANMALNAASYAYVLETGRVMLKGSGKELLADESVREAYLGKNRNEKYVN